MLKRCRLACLLKGASDVFRRFVISIMAAIIVASAGVLDVKAEGALDGRSFSGMIGPAENPDLADSLFFNDGHFWSDICTRCGFVPGPYDTEETADGVRFIGTLESKSRGRFDYDGLVADDGSILVSITWERRRWYWTSRREIVFRGEGMPDTQAGSLAGIRREMQVMNPDGNPMCARF